MVVCQRLVHPPSAASAINDDERDSDDDDNDDVINVWNNCESPYKVIAYLYQKLQQKENGRRGA